MTQNGRKSAKVEKQRVEKHVSSLQILKMRIKIIDTFPMHYINSMFPPVLNENSDFNVTFLILQMKKPFLGS